MMHLRVMFFGLLFGLLGAVPAQASLPIVGSQPAISSDGLGPLEAIEDLPHLHLEALFWLDSSHQILKVSQTIGSNTNDLGYLISYRLSGLLQASMGLYDLVTVSLGIPVTYHQGSGLDRSILGVALVEPGAGVGDVALNVHGKILSEKDYFVDLALLLPMTLPTANEASYSGEAGVSMTPTVAAAKTLVLGGADDNTYSIRIQAELGYQIRKQYELEGMLFSDQIHYTFGASSSLEPWLGLSLDAFAAWVGSIVLEKGAYGDRIYPQEFQAGGAWTLPSNWVEKDSAYISMSRLTFGFGMGLGASPVSPSLRLFLGLEGGHQITFDSDDDGINDNEDGCPNSPEDMDGLGDQDGCPEDDYDADGISDVDDKCPDAAETKNDFQEEDGCPDKRLDSDNDKVFDDLDKCVDKAEDLDEFEDEDGCPELDNDQDGIEDEKDKCPLEAEDFDEFEDGDGCPDLDNDADGVLDTVDKCPLDPENAPAEAERDGCPEVTTIAEPEPKTIETRLGDVLTDFAKGVQFAHATKTPAPKSNRAIDKIISFLKEHMEIKKILITGHTDSVGDTNRNLFLSKRRATILRERLVAGGISVERIDIDGKGSAEPIARNDTQAGRGLNRRIVIQVKDLQGSGVGTE
ncbi:MAG: OmpA family protein [Deltaproteobacteria bacterium]|nr:OmpA family protein [Deltaproteobacteria bacterium]